MTVHTHHQFYDLRFHDTYVITLINGLWFMNKKFCFAFIFMKIGVYSSFKMKIFSKNRYVTHILETKAWAKERWVL